MDFLITDELKDLGRVKMTPEQKELLKYFRPYDQPVSPPTTPPPVHRMDIDDLASQIEQLQKELREVQLERIELQNELDMLQRYLIPDRGIEAIIVDLMITRDKINQHISNLKKRIRK